MRCGRGSRNPGNKHSFGNSGTAGHNRGFTQLVANLLYHPSIDVELGIDFLDEREAWIRRVHRVVYSGPIDAYFAYRYGRLDYRSLRLEHETHQGWFQRAAVVNYTDADVPFTRITEHKHFTNSACPGTVITREYPEAYTGANEPYYPIRDEANLEILEKYRTLAADETTIFGGLLGSYQYFDMDQVIAQAMHTADKCLDGSRLPSRVLGFKGECVANPSGAVDR